MCCLQSEQPQNKTETVSVNLMEKNLSVKEANKEVIVAKTVIVIGWQSIIWLPDLTLTLRTVSCVL